jgi:hypothetical protein
MAIALAVRAEVVVKPPQSLHECSFATLQTG